MVSKEHELLREAIELGLNEITDQLSTAIEYYDDWVSDAQRTSRLKVRVGQVVFEVRIVEE